MRTDAEIARALAHAEVPGSGPALERARVAAKARYLANATVRSAPHSPARGPRRAAILAAVVLALLIVATAATPQGRALAEKLGEVVGIGEESTYDYSDRPSTPAEGKSLVVASGKLPGTEQPYEWVAFVSSFKAHGSDQRSTCMTLDLPNQAASSYDPGVGCVAGLAGDPVRPYEFGETGLAETLGPEYRFAVSGEMQPRVAEVRVSYLDDSGQRVEVPVVQGAVKGDIAERLDAPYDWGQFIAFLPDDGTPAQEPDRPGPPIPGYAASLELRAYNSAGELLGVNRDYGPSIVSIAENAGELPPQIQKQRDAAADKVEAAITRIESDGTSAQGVSTADALAALMWFKTRIEGEATEPPPDLDVESIIHRLRAAGDL